MAGTFRHHGRSEERRSSLCDGHDRAALRGRRPNFIALKGDPTGDDFHALWIDPTDSERQILGVDQGAQITLDGGATWSSWYNQPTAQIYHVSTDNRFPYWVYGAQQDSGAVALPSRTDSIDGITMEQFREMSAGGESGMIAPDPDHPNIVYGGRSTSSTCAPARRAASILRSPIRRSIIAEPGRCHSPSPSRGSRALYFANQRLFRTLDGGEHWAAISPDLTREDAGIPANLDAATAADDDHVDKRRGVIYTIAPSTLSASALWVGTDDGLVWRSDDAGAHWHEVTPAALTPWSKVAGIELSHFDPAVAYLAVDRHRLDDDEPYLYRTATAASSGRESMRAFRATVSSMLFARIRRRGLLYAGTERGMFMSFDDGAHWQPLNKICHDFGARHRSARRRSGDRHAWPWLLDHGRRVGAAADEHARPDKAVLFKPATPSGCGRPISPARPCPRTSRWRPILPTVRLSTTRCPRTLRVR